MKTNKQIINDIQKFNREHNGVSIYNIGGYSFGTPNKKIVFGVNWSSLGTQTPDKTKKFMELLTRGMKIATTANEAEITSKETQ